MLKEEYFELVELYGFKPGDIATLIRLPTEYECSSYGFGCGTNSLKLKLHLNQQYRIHSISERKNCELRLGLHYCFIPQFCFAEFVQPGLTLFSKSKFKAFDRRMKVLYGY